MDQQNTMHGAPGVAQSNTNNLTTSDSLSPDDLKTLTILQVLYPLNMLSLDITKTRLSLKILVPKFHQDKRLPLLDQRVLVRQPW